MPLAIYGLFDPRVSPIVVRYVGFTSKPVAKRLQEHLTEARTGVFTYKCNWLRSVLADGVLPSVLIIEEVNATNWQQREQHWIKTHVGKLTNQTAGGEGLVNPSEDVRKRIGDTLRPKMMGNSFRTGIPHTEESKLSIATGMASSEKYKASIAKRKGRAIPKATEAAANATRGVPKSDSHRAKLSEAHKGVVKVLGYKWFNNGTDERLFSPTTTIPNGYSKGRL